MSEGAMLATSLQGARAETDALFRLLAPDAIYDRPIPERNRLVFYLGHLEAFDWNQIGRVCLDMPSFHPEFDRLFEAGIDPPPGQGPQDQPSDWPSVAEVEQYSQRVRARLDAVLDHAPPGNVQMVLEHRMMHAETFAYLLHQLPYTRKQQVAPSAIPTGGAEVSAGEFIDIPAGIATLGQRAGEFGWDNEFDCHTVYVPAFAIGKHKVTNGEYLEYVRQGAKPPHFWVERGGQWFFHGMFSETPLRLDFPVWVTHREATAYAHWRGLELPTEGQFHRAAYGTLSEAASGTLSEAASGAPANGERFYPWGNDAPTAAHGNFDSHAWDPQSVLAHSPGDSAFGVSQLIGNGWEWTATPFAPFPGFTPASYYLTYSQNFFDGEHFVLKGGSPRTPAGLLRRSFRNWFRPNYPYVYAGFHLIAN
ncbi:MAG TPA: SUMF1/EgtB/PvdO family nonheme iron enzyme [Bryobacteraceae bacterium]|nr:SUMF1/EgtB/PvdO family nonheme iron enzyme [Bryobacteraceae bacterium]